MSTKSTEFNDTAPPERPRGLGKRHVQAFLCFISYATYIANKSNLLFGIMAMIDNKDNPDFVAYDWNEGIRGLLISGIFLSYVFSPTIAGITVKRTGPKRPIVISLILMGMLSVLTPLFASIGWEYVFALRFTQGIISGFCFPCLHTILSRWTHPDERSQLASVAVSGICIGPFVMGMMSGILASSRLGWPSIFYLSGGFAIIWAIVLLVFCHSTPNEHSTITSAELRYIESMPGYESKKQQVPYKKILTSKAYWGVQIAQIGECWSYTSLMSIIPSYAYGVLHMDIVSNGLYSSLPYLTNFITIFIFAIISDWLTRNRYLSLTHGRKLCNSIGLWGPTFCIFLLVVLPVDKTTTIFLFVLSMGLNSGTLSGYLINHIDISPNFAGAIMGMCQSVANIFTFFGPLTVGYLVSDITDKSLWNLEFYTIMGFFLVANIFFLVLGTAEVQEWN